MALLCGVQVNEKKPRSNSLTSTSDNVSTKSIPKTTKQKESPEEEECPQTSDQNVVSSNDSDGSAGSEEKTDMLKETEHQESNALPSPIFRTTTKAQKTTNMDEPQSKPDTTGKVSDREQRRKRREALLTLEEKQKQKQQQDSGSDSPASSSAPNKKRKTTVVVSSPPRNTAANRRTNARRNKTARGRRTTRKNSPPTPKEECVKIKMNTGTLYLYRGLNRRAVFVRKY